MHTILQRLSSSFTCVVHNCHIKAHLNQQIVRNIYNSSVLFAGYDRYHKREPIRQMGENYQTPQEQNPVSYSQSIFPTLETHSEEFDGIKFTDLPVVHIKATSNNTIVSAVYGDGQAFAIQSGGTVGFRNARKGTNVAAQAAAIALAKDVLRNEIQTVRVCLRGIGPGRLPALKALELSGLKVVSISDTTRLAFNGNRPKKQRRL